MQSCLRWELESLRGPVIGEANCRSAGITLPNTCRIVFAICWAWRIAELRWPRAPTPTPSTEHEFSRSSPHAASPVMEQTNTKEIFGSTVTRLSCGAEKMGG